MNALERDILIGCLLTSLAECDCLSPRYLLVPVACLTYGEVLHVYVILILVDEENRSECLIVCRDSARVVHDEHTIGALTNERCVLNDRSKGGGAEVIDAVVEEDTVASSLVGAALCLCKGDSKSINIIDSSIVGTAVFEDVSIV